MEAPLHAEFTALSSPAALDSTSGKIAFLRFMRSHRSALSDARLVKVAGSAARALGRARVGEDFWPILEQTLVAALQEGDFEEAQACLAVLKARFGAYAPARAAAGEEPGAPQEGSLRVRALELLLAEAQRPGKAAVDADYRELRDARPSLPAASRRLAVGADAPCRELAAHVAAHGADAAAWQELGELYAAGGDRPPGPRGALPPKWAQAAFCYEELVLLAPNQAGWHARLCELLCALHGTGGGGEEAARTGLRQARLHGCEAVRLTEGLSAYAAAALADACVLLTNAQLAASAAGGGAQDAGEGGGVDFPRAWRFLHGEPLNDLAAAAAAGAPVEAPALARAAAAARARFAAPPPSAATFDYALAAESQTLHALALHYLRELEGTPMGDPGAPALAVEASLLRSPAARETREAQQSLMKLASDAVQ
jgi:hypothetical protein